MYYIILIIGLIFAYINGMHDGGTVIATAISSRLIPPSKAVVIAGLANMTGALVMGTAVVKTIFSGIIDISSVDLNDASICYIFVLSSFIATIAWNFFTWNISLPSSASHSMIGAMIGSGIAAYGISSVMWRSVMYKVILAMIISPVLGFIISLLFYSLMNKTLKKATVALNPLVSVLHYISSFFLALSYGGNDSQKVAGLILIAVFAGKTSSFHVPYWLMISVGICLSAGTITGGFNMIRTVGFDITKIDIHNSCASQMSTVIVLLISNFTGLPISATQVVSASVMGVGTANTPKAVNWTIAKKTLVAWLVTIPASAATGFVIFNMITIILQIIQEALV